MGTCSEVAAIQVPERLHKIYLLVDREIVEPWRRSGGYLGHCENSYEREYRKPKVKKSGQARLDRGNQWFPEPFSALMGLMTDVFFPSLSVK